MTSDIGSALEKLLHCNRPPNPVEADYVSASIREMEARLATIDTAIANARAVLDRLVTEGKSVEEQLHAQRAILSPIRRVPPELISHIFVFCLPSYSDDSEKSAWGSLALNPFELVLTNVCRRWKDIAFTTPQLWSCINFTLGSESEASDVVRAKTWLARSGKSSLTIKLGTDQHWVAEGSDLTVLDMLIAECERWVDVDLEVPTELMNHLDVVRGRLPLLHKLSLARLAGPDQYLSRWPAVDLTYAFELAPQLRIYHQRIGAETMSAPSQNLTTIVCDIIEREEILELLRMAPNLLELTLTNSVYIPGDTDEMITPVLHPNLHYLKVVMQLSCCGLFCALVLPVLRTLSICFHKGAPSDVWEEDSHAKFVSFLRSTLSIRSLSILEIRSDDHPPVRMAYPQDLMACLNATPFLTCLEIESGMLNSTTVQQLTLEMVRESENPKCTGETMMFGGLTGDLWKYLPKLNHITIHVKFSPKFDNEEDWFPFAWKPVFPDIEFAEFIESRWESSLKEYELPRLNYDLRNEVVDSYMAQLCAVTLRFPDPSEVDPMPVYYGIPVTWKLLKRYQLEGLTFTAIEPTYD